MKKVRMLSGGTAQTSVAGLMRTATGNELLQSQNDSKKITELVASSEL